MKIDIIEKFEVEGRGIVFTCYLPELKTYSEASQLISQIFEYKGEKFLIRNIEMSRGGVVDIPNRKTFFGLLVRKI